MYMSGTGSIYDQASAANLFGQGAQVTAQGTYVPQPDGTYQLVPHGQAAGALTDYGNTLNPATAGGGMFGSQYGATGPDLNPQVPQSAYPVRSGNPYSSPTPSMSTQSYNQQQSVEPSDGGYYSAWGGAGMSQPGGIGASTASPTSMNPTGMNQSDVTSLMNMLGQFTGNQQAQPLPTSGPTGMNYDSALMQYLQQAMGQTGSQLNYGAGTTPQSQQALPEQSWMNSLSGLPSNIANQQAVQYINGGLVQGSGDRTIQKPTSNALEGMLRTTFTIDGQPGTYGGTQYSNGQNATSSNPLGGMIPFPLPGGSGQGGSVGIPLPTPTPISPLPVGAPGAAPVAPWNQQQQTTSPSLPPSVAQAAGIMQLPGGDSVNTSTMSPQQAASTLSMYGASLTPQQQQQLQSALNPQQQAATTAQSTPAGNSASQSGFNFGGTPATGTTQQTTATSVGSSNSLLSLLGGLPQPPSLQITPPTVDASGNFANMPGGEAIRSAIQPVLNSQQIGQLQNQATGQNAQQAATAENLARENMAARGFSAGSGALGDTNQQIAAARMMADTQANSQIPIGAAKLNNDSMMQQLGLNLQGQQNAISSYGQMSDMLKNNAALGAQTYGLGIQGYNAYQSALNNLLNNQLQSQGLGVQQYGQDVNAYNAQQNAMNNYLQNYLAANQLQLSGNNANYQNWLGLGNLLNNSTATDNQFTSSLLNSLLGAA